MTSDRKLTGRCQCGQITYVVTGEPVIVGHCYCTNCQRLSGAGHSTAAMFPASRCEISGTPSEYSFEGTGGVVDTRLFCPRCGSNLFGRNSAVPGHLSVALGTLDDSSALAPQGSVYVKQKAVWDLVDDKIKVFEGGMQGRPVSQ